MATSAKINYGPAPPASDASWPSGAIKVLRRAKPQTAALVKKMETEQLTSCLDSPLEDSLKAKQVFNRVQSQLEADEERPRAFVGASSSRPPSQPFLPLKVLPPTSSIMYDYFRSIKHVRDR